MSPIPMSQDDNRRYPRAPMRRRVWCEGEDVTLYVRTLNVSARGMFIRTSSPADAGRQFRVCFDDDDGTEVVADVKVRWSSDGADGEPGMGVEIVEFEKGSERYQQLVEQTLAEGDGLHHSKGPESDEK